MKMRTTIAGIALAVLASASAAVAADPTEQHNSNAFWFENWIGLSNGLLKVVAPNGQITEVFAASGTPVFELTGRDVPDGVYRYELSAATEERVKIVNSVNNGRGEDAPNDMAKPFHLSGSFVVSRGAITQPEDINEDEAG